jgi:hypothetical protein
MGRGKDAKGRRLPGGGSGRSRAAPGGEEVAEVLRRAPVSEGLGIAPASTPAPTSLVTPKPAREYGGRGTAISFP